MRNRLNFVTLCVGCLLAATIASCGSDTQSIDKGRPDDGFSSGAPSMAQLEDMLDQEFARLGIDPSRAISQAPLGPQNQVFDLGGTVIDPDGELGPNPPTGIELDWTELANGDYDQNGIIAVNDLTPIGQNFGLNVSYDDPSLHGGFPAWPAGDPEDDGGAADDQPPAEGSPAQNWRRSRVDGNVDGLVSVQDLTNIAVHFGEKIAGYRVYRKAPGESDFALLENPLDGSSPLTIVRVAPNDLDTRRPVRYHFTDDLAGVTLGDGDQLQYFVAPYDITGSSEGQASITLTMSVGTVSNNPPVADITATPSPVDVNTDVTFDASGSTDDFGVTGYEWDLDGNGSFETDTGSTATVTTQYAVAGPVTVTVRVTDAGGLTDTDFMTLQVIAPAGHTISGFVLTDASSPLGGVQMTLNPGGLTTQTIADGSYAFNSVLDGDYTVTATLSGYTMAPNPANVTLSGADQTTVNFTATEITGTVYTIGGTVTRLTEDWADPIGDPNAPDEPFPGVTVIVYASDHSTIIGQADTDANGHYEVTNIPENLGDGVFVACDPADVDEIGLPIGGEHFVIPVNQDDLNRNFLDKNGHTIAGN